jgi:hypothetical protein
MAIAKQVVGTRTALAFTGAALSTLASATYVSNTTAYDCTVGQPQDVILEFDFATTNTPAGNKQCVVFIQESLDGVVFRGGPSSGTDRTREPSLKFLTTVAVTVASTTDPVMVSVASLLGYVPAKFYVVVYNDMGVALTSATVFTSEISYV